jgi:hypothetical protein
MATSSKQRETDGQAEQGGSARHGRVMGWRRAGSEPGARSRETRERESSASCAQGREK